MKHRITKRAVPAALFLGAALSFPAAARADAPDPAHAATAQALYDAATADMESGRYVAASRKLEEVMKLVPEALGARLTLAECHENMGRLATAWAGYLAVRALALREGQSERAELAAQRAAALRPRLAMLAIHVPAGAAAVRDLSITRDGAPVGEVQWGAPLPVDTGVHEIVVTAPGHVTWRKRVEVPSDGVQIEVSVPAPAPMAAEVAPPAAAAVTGRPWQRPLGLGTIGVGAAGVIIGAAALGLSASRQGASGAHCDASDACDWMGASLRRDAQGLGGFAAGALVVGGLVAGAGVVLVLTSPSDGGRADRGKTGLRAVVSPGGGSLGFDF